MKMYLPTLLTLWSMSSMTNDAHGQGFRVFAGVRTSIVDYDMVPRFIALPNAFANLWDFKPGLGYDFGLSKVVPLKKFELEPEIRYGHNVIKQSIRVVNRSMQTLQGTQSIWTLGNNVVEVAVPIKKRIFLSVCELYVIAGPFCQFRKNESLRNQLGEFTFPLENNRFEYGLNAGLETTGVLSFRLMGQFSKTVFASSMGSYRGSTLSLTTRCNISSLIKHEKAKKAIRVRERDTVL
ncbi:hypothetical protein M0L20_29790 [Spirosoma sp. RP8]|uniref:PorT family protein n=1 Tax=Spirosoma liriopis TaxID=2937440 RepID=A0ABT0HV87_9BACT|nr:hypothetical protein [Spirosoma liriopis]MCK8496096.1 hypothetical protein [Spirosoma liriopis]